MPLPQIPLDDPRVLALAKARQQFAHECTIEYHRAQVRKFHGFSEPTVGDEDRLADWLAADICPMEMSRDRLGSALLARCREVRIEPPKTTRIERVLGAAEAMFERQLTEAAMGRSSAGSVGKLEELIVADAPVSVPGAASAGTPEGEDEGQAGKASRAFLQELKEDPGAFQLDTLLAEIVKLERARASASGTPCCLPSSATYLTP